LKDFAYICPGTIEEAIAAMAAGDARALAGGTDLIPQLREGRRHTARVVDLKRVPELNSVGHTPDGGVSIGAAANATLVSGHAVVARAYPAIAESARLIGGVQIHNRASLSGPSGQP
jgi:CO/xanthine dehydrogenase FAD-binding subunit